MKKTLVSIFFLSILFFSCSDDNTLIPEFQKPADIETRQLVLDNWIPPSPCEAANLTVFIHPNCLGTEWEHGVLNAMNAYNDAPTGINFSLTSSANDADIEICCEDFNIDNLIGVANFPSSDYTVGDKVFLNTHWLGLCDDDCFYQGLVMHEFGHSLGIAHNEHLDGEEIEVHNWVYLNGELLPLGPIHENVSWVEGTSPPGESDLTSVFNSLHDCDITLCEFNQNDILALQSLYPESITGPAELCPGEIGTFCLTNIKTKGIKSSITWQFDGQILPQNPISQSQEFINCHNFSSLVPGEHTVTASITTGNCSYDATMTVIVLPEEDCD